LRWYNEPRIKRWHETDYDRVVRFFRDDFTIDLFGPLPIDGELVERDREPGPPLPSEDEDV
jgi:hypothetical protein